MPPLAHDLLLPQPAQPGHDFGAQVARRGHWQGREVAAQPPQREDRRRVAQRVGREGQGTAGLVQRGAQRRPGDAGGSEAGQVDGTGLRQLRSRHHARQRGHLGQIVEDHQRALDHRHGHDVRQRRVDPQRGQRQVGHRRATADVAQQHQAAAVPAVHHRAHRQAQQDEGRDAQRGHPADGLGRTGERQHQQRVDDAGRVRAQRGHAHAALQPAEVALLRGAVGRADLR